VAEKHIILRYGFIQHWLAKKRITHSQSDAKMVEITAKTPFYGYQHFQTANRLSLSMSKQHVIFLLVLNAT
jgi:fumarate reductase subunit D